MQCSVDTRRRHFAIKCCHLLFWACLTSSQQPASSMSNSVREWLHMPKCFNPTTPIQGASIKCLLYSNCIEFLCTLTIVWPSQSTIHRNCLKVALYCLRFTSHLTPFFKLHQKENLTQNYLNNYNVSLFQTFMAVWNLHSNPNQHLRSKKYSKIVFHLFHGITQFSFS